MAETTKMPYSYWTSIGKHVDFYFDADKALEIGLLDEVIQSGRSS
jgi:ATP-dependent protease ClpP protease subunit